MESKTCSAFPVMGDRPYSAFLRSSRAKGFNSGPPAHPDNFILVSNFDGVEYMCQDGYGHLDCEWSFDMVPLLVCFSIFIVWSFPFDIFSKGYRSSPSSSWLVTKKIKVLLGDCQSVFTTCRCDFSSLHPEFRDSRIPALALDLFQGSFWIAVPVEARSSFTAMVLSRAQYGLDVSSGWIISIRGWSPWVSG